MNAEETDHLPGRGPMWARLDGQQLAPLLILVVVLLFAAFRYDGFYNAFNVRSILSSTDLICVGLMATGLTFVISAGEIDLSVAGVAVVSSVIAATAAPQGLSVSVAASIGFGVLAGSINGALVAFARLPSFIVTLAMLLAMRGLALIISDRDKISVASSTGLAKFYDLRYGDYVPVPFVILVSIVAVAWLLFSKLPFGRHVLAIGGNNAAAGLMGLRVRRTTFAVFVLTGLLSGLAGALLTAKTTTGNPLEAQGWELIAIAAVVLGGTRLTGGKGSVPSTLTGVALLALVFQVINFENGQGISINSYWQNVIRGLFLLVIIVAQALATHRAETRSRARARDAIEASKASVA